MTFPTELGNELLMRLLLIAALIGALVVLVRLAQRFASRSQASDPSRVYHAKKVIRRVGITVGVVSTIALLSPDVRGLVTLLTVVGAGLAIALREALLSVAGWIRLSMLAPYKIGDRIEIGEVRGDVIDIRVMRTSLMEIGGWVQADQSTGRIVHIPNSWVFEHAVFNYSRGFRFIWNELPIIVTFRSDWRAAADIMQGFAEESAAIIEQQAAEEIRTMSSEFLIHYGILTPFVYTEMAENGVRLTLRYLCEARKRRGTAHALTISILDAFRENGNIEFSYPTLAVAKLEGRLFGPDDAETLSGNSNR
jgi:small-conductance mechanosensitive channel